MLPIFQAATPEIFVLVMVCVIMLVELYLSRAIKGITYVFTQVTLIISMVLIGLQFNHPTVVTFHGQFIQDHLANVLKFAILASGFLVFWYGKSYNEQHKVPQGEYHILGLLSILGAMVLVSAGSLLTLYLGLELMSLPLYAMIALRRDNMHSVEAGMKYFVMGAIASGFLLYGFSLLYGLTGQLQLSLIVSHLANHAQYPMAYLFAVLFIVAALAFKFGAVPFHMWVPDVYHGSPTSVTTFLASIPKLAALAMILRILSYALPDWQAEWGHVLMILAMMSLFLGNIVAISQTNIKRLLGYSTISHVGFVLLAVSLGSVQGDRAALFYILVYVLTTVGAFGMILLMARQGIEADTLADFRGLNKRNSWYALLMMLLMLSMAGVPPLVGFEAKLFVLQGLVAQHHYGVAIFALIMSVIGAYYYIRIIKVMYFEEPDVGLGDIKPGCSIASLVSINALAVLVLGFVPAVLYSVCIGVF